MSQAELSPPPPPLQVPAPPPVVLTLEEVCAATGARLQQGDPAGLLGPLDLDSRRLGPGDWFLAHRGSQQDGHDYLDTARGLGAAGAVVTDPGRLPAGWSLPTLVVADHAAFLEQLGTAIRQRFTGQVIGITGSVGKTSCRHVLAHLLAQDRAVLATPWNWNTEIGIPLTLSRLLRQGAEVCVLELAMRGPGQIAQLTRIVQPHIGILTGIAPVHLELLGSLWGILEAKLELFATMDPAGTWVYPAPDAFIRGGLAALPLQPRQAFRFLPGQQLTDPGDPDLLIMEKLQWEEEPGRWSGTLHWQTGREATEINAIALGQVWSALAASAGALAAGLPLQQITERLPLVPPAAGRMELRRRFPQRLILFDAYNSNPASATDALETLARIARQRPAIAILGGMKELGPESERYHRELGTRVRSLGIPALLAVGTEAEWIATGAAGGDTSVFTVDTAEAAAAWCATQVPGDAVVLLKGSRAYALETILDAAW